MTQYYPACLHAFFHACASLLRGSGFRLLCVPVYENYNHSAFPFAHFRRLCIFCPSFPFNPFTLYVHILSFSAGPSPGYPRVLSISFRCFFYFFSPCLLPLFWLPLFIFLRFPWSGSSCCVGVVVFAGVACVGVVVHVS